MNIEQYEQYEEEFSNIQNYCTCHSCNESFVFEPDDIWWDENSCGYSTKLCKCPYCGSINIVKYIEDYGLDVNFDERFYLYK